MLTKEPSFASLLVKQSPAMHYGHGWIYLPCGKKWHPSFELQPRQQAYRGINKKRFLQRFMVNVANNLRTKRKVFLGS
ncbi:DUF2724 domain-containing protein [Escherichia coli]|nr:DUF2724 domain-containing protein [Escherichia coli]